MKEAIEVCASIVLKNPLKGHCPPKQCPNKFFKLFGNQPFGVPGTPIFTNSGICQRYTWYTQLLVEFHEKIDLFFRSFFQVFPRGGFLIKVVGPEEYELGEGGYHWLWEFLVPWTEWEWIPHPFLFFGKLLRSNVTKDACIVDGRDCTTLFCVGLIWNPLWQKSK